MGRTSIQWTDEMIALRGTDKDAVLAERWGTTAKTINLKRNSLGIAALPAVVGAAAAEGDGAAAPAAAKARKAEAKVEPKIEQKSE